MASAMRWMALGWAVAVLGISKWLNVPELGWAVTVWEDVQMAECAHVCGEGEALRDRKEAEEGLWVA